ncbi:MAG: hypothetical protein ACT4N8_08315 [Sphingosinicella sp.]
MTRTVMLLILALVLALAAWWLWREWRIDSCSADRGEWNYSTEACDPLPR